MPHTAFEALLHWSLAPARGTRVRVQRQSKRFLIIVAAGPPPPWDFKTTSNTGGTRLRRAGKVTKMPSWVSLTTYLFLLILSLCQP